MVNNNNTIETDSPYKLVTITLSDDFKQRMVDSFNDEFSIAQEKWGIRLNSTDKEFIKKHTISQLTQKVKDITYNDWNIDENTVSIRIVAENPEDIISNVNISENNFAPSFMSEKLIVYNVTKGYTIVNIPTRKTVRMGDFYDFFLETMITWLRTGCFYGVASYSS